MSPLCVPPLAGGWEHPGRGNRAGARPTWDYALLIQRGSPSPPAGVKPAYRCVSAQVVPWPLENFEPLRLGVALVAALSPCLMGPSSLGPGKTPELLMCVACHLVATLWTAGSQMRARTLPHHQPQPPVPLPAAQMTQGASSPSPHVCPWPPQSITLHAAASEAHLQLPDHRLPAFPGWNPRLDLTWRACPHLPPS